LRLCASSRPISAKSLSKSPSCSAEADCHFMHVSMKVNKALLICRNASSYSSADRALSSVSGAHPRPATAALRLANLTQLLSCCCCRPFIQRLVRGRSEAAEELTTTPNKRSPASANAAAVAHRFQRCSFEGGKVVI
jgi:hypothetical protein